MGEERKQELEGMLRAVQEIKSEYYVGSLEAYGRIKQAQASEENPAIAANYINDSVQKRFSETTYLATPARVTGIENALRKAGDYASKPFLDGDLQEFPQFYLEDNFKEFEIFGMNFSVHDSPKESAKMLLPYFIDANANQIRDNQDFGSYFAFHLLDSYRKTRMNISRGLLRKCDEWIGRIMDYFQHVELDREMSKGVYSERLRNTLSYDLSPTLGTIIDRVLNDKVDHRLEYRRQIVAKYLRDTNPNSWEEAIANVNHWLARREERARKNLDYNAPAIIIKNDERIIKQSKFLRHVLGSEKNFVTRFLRS